LSQTAIDAKKKAETEIAQLHQMVIQQDADLLLKKKQFETSRQMQMEHDQHQADIDESRRRSHEVGGKGPLTDWQAMDERRARNNADNAKLERNFTGGMEWRKQWETNNAVAAADRKQMGGGDMLRATLESNENRSRIARMAELGIITDEDRGSMIGTEMENHQRKIRQAKYGNQEADGGTGFGSADVKSVGGFNNLLKSLRYSKQTDELSELKKNGDILAEMKEYSRLTNEILKSAPTTVVNF
jgi:hypothetical protein